MMEDTKVKHDDLVVAVKYGLTKPEIETLAIQKIAEWDESGVSNSPEILSIAEQIAAGKEFLEMIRANSRFIGAVRDQLQLHPKGKMLSSSGAQLSIMEAGTKYDYSTDPTWRELNMIAEDAIEARKARETLLKAIPSGQTLMNSEGEITAFAPIKTSTSTFMVKLLGDKGDKK